MYFINLSKKLYFDQPGYPQAFKNLTNFILNGKLAYLGQFPGAVTNASKLKNAHSSTKCLNES